MWRKVISIIFLWFFSLIPGFSDPSQNGREFDQEKINSFRKDKTFVYEYVENESDAGWLERLLNSLFRNTQSAGLGRAVEIFIYILCAGLIIYVILKLIKADFSWIFQSRKSSGNEIKVYEEEWEIPSGKNLDHLLEEAIRDKNYRLAVRYYYLITLNELKERELIVWSAEKTNYDYVNEIADPFLKNGFKNVSYLFEYVWYGEFIPDGVVFQKVKGSFDSYIASIKKGPYEEQH